MASNNAGGLDRSNIKYRKKKAGEASGRVNINNIGIAGDNIDGSSQNNI